jgi:hypothetical protein
LQAAKNKTAMSAERVAREVAGQEEENRERMLSGLDQLAANSLRSAIATENLVARVGNLIDDIAVSSHHTIRLFERLNNNFELAVSILIRWNFEANSI